MLNYRPNRKSELFDGMIATPVPNRRGLSRRKSPFDGSDAEGDSSSAAETTNSVRNKPVRRRGVPKFTEHIDEDESTPITSPDEGTTPSPRASSSPNGKANGEANGKVLEKEKVADGWRPGMDPKVDNSGVFEFGGSAGTLAMMLGFPVLMWYMWVGATYYNGKFPMREPGQSWGDFGQHLFNLVYTGAYPHAKAWAMYWIFFVFEGALYCILPGVKAYGKPLPHEDGKQLPYHCSAYPAFYTTIVVAAALHFSGLFPLYTIIDEFGPLLTVAIISGYIVAIVAYISAFARGATHRMTGYPIYDFFMGAELNPRMFGIIDFKMFFEVRLPWYILFLLSAGTAARQYETYGYVSGEVIFILMAHYLYANACSKGEELIVTTWDMYYEKWGFMLIFWNMAGVPLSYCHCTIFLANHDPATYQWPRPFLAAMFVAYLFVYWVWDTCNGQKNAFRASESGRFVKRNTFPQLPGQVLKNPRTIQSPNGTILVDGWYKHARKLHYACDAFFAICWGLVTGFSSPFPWFYPLFFCAMITHRATRDIERCRLKYGDAWLQYEKEVPYLFIPVSFIPLPPSYYVSWKFVI